ncbi:MAG: CBS domain-containing protein [Acidimicrobiales bacterium]
MSEAVNSPRVVLTDAMTVHEAITLLRNASVPGAPVVDENGSYTGTVEVEALTVLAEGATDRRVRDLADSTAATVSVDATLDVGLEALVQAGGHWVPVTGKNREVAGILAISDIVRAYRQSLDTNIGKIAQITSHAVAVEERIGPRSKLVGAPIRSAGLPPGCVVITVQRGNDLLFATGSTTFAEGDVVSSLTSPTSVEQLRLLVKGVGEKEPIATSSGDPVG